MYDVIIIGAGVVGAATAYRLSRYRLKLLVLEKENDVAMGATRANSAIIHAGFDPEPGTLMAKLNVEGCEMAGKLAGDLSVPYKNNGSLVLGFDDADLGTLKALRERGIANGVKDLRLIDASELISLEPNVSREAKYALLAPTAGIIDPWEYATAFCEVAAANGTEFRFCEKVETIKKTKVGYIVSTGLGSYATKYIINAAGVHSDAVHEMISPKRFTITPVRGDYCVLDKAECFRAERTLFQCPSKLGKGVLVTPTVHGNLLVGPDAVNCKDADRVNTTAESIAYIKSAALKSVPGIEFRQTIRSFAGMRANSDYADFIIGFAEKGFLDLAGIKSPGLTAAPAIAKMAEEMLANDGLKLIPNPDAVTKRKKIRFNELSPAEKRELIGQNPLYGRVICRCETVTEGEIVDALHSPLPPRSVDGVKRRVTAGMGRCQGGFCSPRVVEILARELRLSPLDIPKDGQGSYILAGETKAGENK